MYNQISRLSYGGSNSRIENSSIDYSLQTEVHKEVLKKQYPSNKLYTVTRSISGSSPYDLSATKGTLVGVIKTQDPMGNPSKWYVDNGSVKGFLERHYLELCNEPQSIEDYHGAGNSEVDSSLYLMSLESPIKDSKKCITNLQSRYSNIDFSDDQPPNYEKVVTSQFQPQLYQNINEEVSSIFSHMIIQMID